MRTTGRSLLIVLAGTLVLLPGPASAATSTRPVAKKKPTCAMKHAETVATSRFGKLLVTHRESDDLYGDSTELFACRPGYRPVQIDATETGQSLHLAHVVFTEHYVAYSFSSTDSQCTKYFPGGAECYADGAASFNTRTGRPRARLSASADALVLSQHGWVAAMSARPDAAGRIVGYTLTAARRTTVVLDEGDLDPSSLRLAAGTLSWSAAGTAKSVPFD